MDAFANALSTGLSTDAIFGAVTPFVPIIITAVIVGIGFYVVRRNTKKISHGKGGTI